VLAPQQILDRVSDRFTLLSRGRRDSPGRQQTLRACLEWSFDLCTKPERLLWARLSVFVGGFTLDAVEGVCCDDLLPARDLVDVLAGLVDKSVVDRIEGGGDRSEPTRYRMLESLRDFGTKQLIEDGEQVTFRGRHRDWYQQLLAPASAEWSSHRQPYWQALLTEEQPNLRAAIEFSLATPGQAEAAFLMVLALPRAIWRSGVVTREGLSWLDRALAQAPAPTVARARALVLAGALALHHDAEIMARRLDEGERLAGQLDDHFSFALAGYVRSVAAYVSNDLTGTIEWADRGLSFLPGGPTPRTEQDPSLRLHLLLQLLWATALVGDHDRSRRCYHEIQQITEPRGEIAARAAAGLGTALLAWRAGDVQEADRYARDSVLMKQSTRTLDLHICGQSIELLAWTAVIQQRNVRAATLLGVADTMLTDRGTPISSLRALTADHADCERRTRMALDDATFTGAFRHGQTLSLDDAIAYALEQKREPRPTPPTAHDTETPLTRREHQIAELVAQGLSNQDIARRLVISPRTAEGHIQHILTKLGFTSRAQVAAWITGHGRRP
jgi:DNA-binding NarL/FixJ family response regulator